MSTRIPNNGSRLLCPHCGRPAEELVRESLGIPDWRDANSYSSLEGLTQSEWRWEFLRRSSQYHRDWESLQICRSLRELGAISDTDARLKAALYQMAQRHNLERPNDPSISALEFRHSPIAGILDPESVAFTDEISPFLTRRASRERRKQDSLLLSLDLRKALNPQLKAASEQARKRQKDLTGLIKTTPKPQPTKWPTYLRVIDARTCGASLSQIGREILRYQANPPKLPEMCSGRRAPSATLAALEP